MAFSPLSLAPRLGTGNSTPRAFEGLPSIAIPLPTRRAHHRLHLLSLSSSAEAPSAVAQAPSMTSCACMQTAIEFLSSETQAGSEDNNSGF
eukprot:11626659-Alexandrium_andersonii.AAC.1